MDSKLLSVFEIVITAMVVRFFVAFSFQLLWNFLLPSLTGTASIGYLQSLGIVYMLYFVAGIFKSK